MEDKRVLANKDNVLNLQKFLIDICSNPNNYNNQSELIKTLGNQKSLSKYNNEDFNLKESSLNTLKRTCAKIFLNGFDEIDTLRVLALQKLTENLSSNNEKDYSRASLLAKIKKQEFEISQQQKTSMVCMSQLLETLYTLKNINSSDNLNVIHMLSTELIKKLTALSLYSTDFLPLKTQNNNLFLIKKEPNE